MKVEILSLVEGKMNFLPLISHCSLYPPPHSCCCRNPSQSVKRKWLPHCMSTPKNLNNKSWHLLNTCYIPGMVLGTLYVSQKQMHLFGSLSWGMWDFSEVFWRRRRKRGRRQKQRQSLQQWDSLYVTVLIDSPGSMALVFYRRWTAY